MKKLLLLAGIATLMGACAESSTAPSAAKKAPSAVAHHDDFTCPSGYILAYDEDGNPICVPISQGDQSKVRRP